MSEQLRFLQEDFEPAKDDDKNENVATVGLFICFVLFVAAFFVFWIGIHLWF